MKPKAWKNLVLVTVLYLIPEKITALLERFQTNDVFHSGKTVQLGSLLECLAFAHKAAAPAASTNYDPVTGQCSIINLQPYSIFKAFNMSSTEGSSHYIDTGCVPTCKHIDPHPIHEDPSAFPPDLYVYIPLSGTSGTSLDVHYYKGPSLVKQSDSLTMALWDQPFFDGSYPLWIPEDSTIKQRFYLSPVKSFSSLSMLGWIFVGINEEKKTHPVLTLVKSGSWDSASVLGAGNINIGDRVSLSYSANSGNLFFIQSDDEVIKRGTWQHVAGTYDASTGEAHLYYNGENIKSGNFGTGRSTYNLDQLISYFAAKMDPSGVLADDICQGCALMHQELYERSLSAAEVKQIYERFSCAVSEETCPTYP